MTLIRTESLCITVAHRPLCTNLDLEVLPGQRWAVLGGNGSGKTTLLHTLAGLRAPAAGRISVQDRDLALWDRNSLARILGILFQDSQDTFPCSVLETVLTGRYPHLPFWAVESREDMERARSVLAQVDLLEQAGRQVDTLSGGERRRLAIATLLLQDPSVWLLDEPTNHLDLRHQVSLLNLLLRRAGAAGGMVMALHDVNLALRYCSHALLIVNHDDLVAGPVTKVVEPGTLERLYRHPIGRMQDASGRLLYYPE